MNLFTDSIFTIGQAAHIAGLSAKALRNWFDKGQVQIVHNDARTEGGWRRLTLLEIFHVAAVGRLIRYGFGVSFASEVLREAVEAQMRRLAKKKCVDFSDLKCFIGLRVFVRHTSGGGCTSWFARSSQDDDERGRVEDFVELNFAGVIIDCWQRLDKSLKNGELESLGIVEISNLNFDLSTLVSA